MNRMQRVIKAHRNIAKMEKEYDRIEKKLNELNKGLVIADKHFDKLKEAELRSLWAKLETVEMRKRDNPKRRKALAKQINDLERLR